MTAEETIKKISAKEIMAQYEGVDGEVCQDPDYLGQDLGEEE